MSWLTYRENVKKTPAIVRAVELLDPFFESESSEVTSGWRAPLDQVRIISEKLKKHSIYNDFPEFDLHMGADPDFGVEVGDEILYYWQRGWSKCLNIGDIVNPPIPARVLYDYFRPGSQTNRKGETIQISPHQRGLAFDIGGGKNLTEKAKRVMKAFQDGSCFITDFLVEHINNCVHVGVRQIG